MGRPYTGFDQIAGGKRAGFETFIDLLEAHFGLWNNGTYGVRKKRGKSSYSVHATGRAGDLSWRGAPYRGPGNYQAAVKMMDFLAAHANELFVEAIFDYYPAPHGRGWKCDRAAWQVYNKPAFSGAPGGDWVHVEVSNAKADDPQYYIDTMKRLLGDPPKPVAPAPAQKTQVPPPNKSPWFQRGSKGEGVKEVQRIVGAEPVDGDFGPKTEEAVKAYQADHDQHVDGIWGPSSDKHSKSDCDHGKDEAKEEVKDAPKPVSSVKIGPESSEKAPEGPQSASMKYPGPPMIKVGSLENEAVKLIQAKVGAKVDGDYGPQTRQMVRNWQAANNCKSDGIVGPATWKAMFG